MELGKLSKVDLRKAWPHEAHNFTKWLCSEDGAELISSAIGMEIEIEERESAVGDFSVDIYAIEENTGRRIIIENQLADTDHDHLGKIITYAAGKDAAWIIWIVRRARDEHKKAIEWLNNHTDEDIGFFLLEIELWEIDGSNPAPKFNVVESPNEWAKGQKSIKNISASGELQLRFWTAFKEFAGLNSEFKNVFSLRKAYAHAWYDLSVGSSQYYISLSIAISKGRASVAIYITDDSEFYMRLCGMIEEIEKKYEVTLHSSAGKKHARIFVERDISIADEKCWPAYFGWLCENALVLRKIIKEVK